MPSQTPVAAWQQMMLAGATFGAMAFEAQAVIAMRLWGMAGWWNLGPHETGRMVGEKLAAAIASQAATGRAVLAGQGPGAVALAAIKPVRRRTKANALRLARRGLRD